MSKPNFNRSFAIILGINNYENGIPALETAAPDALKLAQIIQEQHTHLKPQYQAQNKYEVQLLLNQRVTLKKLKQLIEDFKKGQILLDKEKVTVNKDDRVLFYFAGHGIADNAMDNEDGPVGYLIPQDATGDKSTYLPMQELHDALNALPCRHMLAILDCCFAGAFRWASLKRDIVPKVTVYKERYDRFICDAAWQVITSAADDQKALDSLGQRGKVIDGDEVHSPFAKALFDALRGGTDEGADSNKDCIITATELYSYLRDRVEILTENNYKRQTPGLCQLKKHDKGEFIFLLPNFDRDKLQDAPPLNLENNPYRGLESYDEKDSGLFFGRKNLIKHLYQRVVANKQALTVVLGASGTGKSSLMKAGLLPRLRQNSEHQFQILAPMRPGESPLKALAQVCLPANTMTAEELAKDEQGLANIVERWSQTNPKTKLLLPVDQFEELITLCKSDEEREQFQKLILNAIAKYPDKIHVVITLRLDFEAQFQTSVLKDFWNDETRFVVPPMTQDEFREAIEKPASEKVVYFDPPSLVDELINEVAQMPGSLPLLSFTLSELYLKYLEERRDNRALKKEDYEQLGRVVGSLTQRADREYKRLVAEDSGYKNTIRRVMLRMISVQGGELARRQVPKPELIYPSEKETERINTVIKRFSDARLIVEGSNPQGEPYVEPAHDALVTGWGRIRGWLNERQAKVKAVSQWNQLKTWFNGRLVKGNSNRAAHPDAEKPLKVNLPLQRELTTAANNWSRKKESDTDKQAVGFLWDRDPRLPQLEQIQQSDDNWFNKTESQFVERSITQKRRNIRNFWIGVGLAFAGVTSFALYFWWQLQQSQLREKAARSGNLLATDPLESLVIAIDAIGQNRNTPIVNLSILPEVQNSLLSAVQTARERNRFTQNAQGQIIAVNPDGKRIASADENGNVYLWDLQSNLRTWKINRTTKGNRTTIRFLEFSPDGKTLIADSDTPNSQFWDLQGNQIQPFGAYGAAITAATFRPDGRLVVGGSKDGTIYWRDLQGNPTVGHRKVSSSVIHAVAFSPDGSTIASADEDGCVYLWQLQTNKPDKVDCEKFANSGEDIRSIAWSKNGGQIIINFDLNSYDTEEYMGHGSFAILLSKNGDKWERSSLEVANPGFSSKVLFAAFSPDGSTIVTGDQDGSVRLLDSKGKEIGQPLLGHSSFVQSVAFSADGKRIISNSLDGTIRLWDVEQNLSNKLKSFSRYGRLSKYGTNVILSPDGQKVAIGGKNGMQGTVTLLDITSNQIGQISVGTTINEAEFSDETYKNGHPLAISSKGYVVVIDESDNNHSRLTLWHPGSTRERQSIGSPDNSVGELAAISPDSQRIVSTIPGKEGSGDSIQLWNIQGNPIGQPVNHKGFSVESIAFSPNGQQIVSGNTNRSENSTLSESSVCLWRLRVTGLEEKNCLPVLGEPTQVALSPDSKTVAIGQQDGGLYLWNLQTNKIGQRFGGNEQPVTSIAFSPDSKTLASGNNDGSVRLWNLEGIPIGRAFQSYTNRRSVQSFTYQREAVDSIAFDRDGKTMIVAYRNGNVRFWQTNLESWLGVACDRLRDHSILKNPGNEEVKGAKKTCETYVWNTQTAQN